MLATLAEPTTSAVLEQIRAVLTGVEVGDMSLIDLYANKGAADPGLVATVLAHAAAQDEYLLPDEWTIVTLDKAVLDAAASHHIPAMTPGNLADLIDEATAQVSEPTVNAAEIPEQSTGDPPE